MEDEPAPWVTANPRVLVEFKTSMWHEVLGEELVADGWDVVSVGKFMADRNKVQRGLSIRDWG